MIKGYKECSDGVIMDRVARSDYSRHPKVRRAEYSLFCINCCGKKSVDNCPKRVSVKHNSLQKTVDNRFFEEVIHIIHIVFNSCNVNSFTLNIHIIHEYF